MAETLTFIFGARFYSRRAHAILLLFVSAWCVHTGAAQDPLIRINAGTSTEITSEGVTYVGDTFFGGGVAGPELSQEISGTNNAALYQTQRLTNDASDPLTYDIPVPGPGSYSVNLHFAETAFNAAGQRVFDVFIEGIKAFENYDIIQQAGAENSAQVEAISGIVVNDNVLTIEFVAEVERAVINGIEVFGSATSVQLPFLLNAGGFEYTGDISVWMEDTGAYFLDGFELQINTPIQGTTDDELYQAERFGNDVNALRFVLPGISPGNYLIELFFSENFFTNVGDRVFDVHIEGNPLLENFDILAEAGSNYTAHIEVFEGITVTDGILNITLIPLQGATTINGIAVTSTQQPPASINASPDGFNFMSQLVETTSTSRILVLENSRASRVTISNVSLASTHASQFNHNFTGPVDIEALESHSIELSFTPTSPGAKSAELIVTHNGNGSPVIVSLIGEGIAPSQIAPSIETISDTTLTIGDPFIFDVIATGEPSPVYSLLDNPDGMLIDSTSGRISWTTTQAGTFTVSVEAANSAGSDTTSFSISVENPLGTAPELLSQSLEVTGPVSFVFQAHVDSGGIPTNVIFEYGVSAVDEAQVVATLQNTEGNGEVLYRADVAGLMENTTYQYRVVAQNSIGRVVGDPIQFTTYQASYQIARNESFDPNYSDSTSYQLISLPGNMDLNVSETFQGEEGVDWQVFLDNSSSTSFLESYDSTDRFNFRPGRGFWALSKNNWVVNSTVETVDLDRYGTYSIPIRTGWNIIGSVYDRQLPWSAVVEANSLPETTMLWSYSKAYSSSNIVMDPYEGYYYFNHDVNRTELIFPYPGLLLATSLASSAQRAKRLNFQWLTIRALVSEGVHTEAHVVLAADALAGQDPFDQYVPRDSFSKVRLSLDPPFDSAHGMLALDARPLVQEGNAYDVSLQAPAGEPVQILIEGASSFQGLDLVLVDRQTGKIWKLHEESEFPVILPNREARYRLLIGSSEFVSQERQLSIPETFSVRQNYPNPFTHSTTIEYSIPEPGSLSVKVYDVLGRLVQVLAEGNHEAGLHQVVWDASNPEEPVTAGMYIVRIQTRSGEVRALKIIRVE